MATIRLLLESAPIFYTSFLFLAFQVSRNVTRHLLDRGAILRGLQHLPLTRDPFLLKPRHDNISNGLEILGGECQYRRPSTGKADAQKALVRLGRH